MSWSARQNRFERSVFAIAPGNALPTLIITTKKASAQAAEEHSSRPSGLRKFNKHKAD
jgi:hypothetical protein